MESENPYSSYREAIVVMKQLIKFVVRREMGGGITCDRCDLFFLFGVYIQIAGTFQGYSVQSWYILCLDLGIGARQERCPN